MYLMDLLKKQKEQVEGKIVDICGQDVLIGALDEEGKAKMLEDGAEYARNKTTINGVEKALIDIDDGRIVVAAIDVNDFDGDKFAFWYIWRQKKIKSEWDKLNNKVQADLKEQLTKVDLWKYVEEAI